MTKSSLEPIDNKELKGEHIEITVNPPNRCNHGGNFKYMTPREIRCQKCNTGFMLEGADRLKDGHLYRGEKLIL
jgi:hypothetical protein